MKKIIAIILGLLLAAGPNAAVLAQSNPSLTLPAPGLMVATSPAYVPVLVKGLRVHPDNPILFDFILDTGDSGLAANSPQLRAESEKLIKYFLASLTIPEDDLWVNLSPYEHNRIIPEALGETVMGRDMLAQDYVLKQLAASLIYPEKTLGREFWNRVYDRARNQTGTTDIPVNTFIKVWIVADKAKVYVHDNTAFVVGSHMKVMLEQDYFAAYKHQTAANSAGAIGSQAIREIILPELEKEVNSGKNFASLRQIFDSMILAAWYKKNLRQALLNQVYSNRAKVNGIEVADKLVKERIYSTYVKAYRKGVFNYIKEDEQPGGEVVARRYFSGGEVFKGIFRGQLTQTTSLTDRDAAMAFKAGPRGQYVNAVFTTPRSAGDLNRQADFAMKASWWNSPGRVSDTITKKFEGAFNQPFDLDPTVSDSQFLIKFPGVRSWEHLAQLSAEANLGERSAAKTLKAFVDFADALAWVHRFNTLVPAQQAFLSEFITPESDQQARDSLKKGEFFIEILAGGMADRAKSSLEELGLKGEHKLPDPYYRMWNIKFWDIIKAAQTGNLKAIGEQSKLLQDAINKINRMEIPYFAKEYTVGQRLLYAISKGIDDIPGMTDEDKSAVRKNLKLVIHVNDDILDSVVEDFQKYKFFGFTPQNILLINGGYGPSYRITPQGMQEEKGTQKVTWNHLFAFLEDKWQKEGVYTFDARGERVAKRQTVNSFLYRHRAKFGLIRRVNDAILLHPEAAMDWQFLSAFLGAREHKGANILYQVMPNTARNKGGLAVKNPDMGDFSFPLEGLDSQEFSIQQKLQSLDKTPYNRLYMMYDLQSTDEATDKNAIPLSVKLKTAQVEGGTMQLFSPESPIGNILLVKGIQGLAVQRDHDLLFEKGILTPQDYEGVYTPGREDYVRGERIHDIKSLRDFVEILAPVYDAMDRGLNLDSFAARFHNNLLQPGAKKNADDAMSAAKGGIDLNARNLDWDVTGEQIGLEFSPAMLDEFRQGDFPGVAPVLIRIVPLGSPLALSQANPAREEEALAQV